VHEALYYQLAEVEDELWWHQGRRQLACDFLRQCRLPAHAAALDVGCGTGGSTALLSQFADAVVGVDLSETAIALARAKHPNATFRVADAASLEDVFPQESFGLITLFHVLYHKWVPDEQQLLASLHRLLTPGGCILITEAAFPSLFRRHDRLAMGKRRYTLPQMQRMLDLADFEWKGGSYFNVASLPAIWLLAKLDSLLPSRQNGSPETASLLPEIRLPPRPINTAMKSVMALEAWLIRRLRRLPLGVSLICTARKAPSTVPSP